MAIMRIPRRLPRNLGRVGGYFRLAQISNTGGVDTGRNPNRGNTRHGQKVRVAWLFCGR
ncbi:hypothetical protein [Synechococcus sp. M16CYN]|uniref:hypothetical protein n=1 Tax=Synechococcus sp. M16CYN TaxID=3103139 RepID=UPI00334290DE